MKTEIVKNVLKWIVTIATALLAGFGGAQL